MRAFASRVWIFGGPLLLALALVSACAKSEPSKSGEEAFTAASVDNFYRERCSGCHGATGAGDGAAAGSLSPKPRSFRDTSWQRAVSDGEISRIILKGGQAAGKSVLMPPNSDLERRPAMLDALVKHVRAFGE